MLLCAGCLKCREHSGFLTSHSFRLVSLRRLTLIEIEAIGPTDRLKRSPALGGGNFLGRLYKCLVDFVSRAADGPSPNNLLILKVAFPGCAGGLLGGWVELEKLSAGLG